MYDEATPGSGRVRADQVEVHLPVDGVAVLAPEPEEARTSMAKHREDVVRRLLGRGLSPRLLRTILPEFRHLIEGLVRRP